MGDISLYFSLSMFVCWVKKMRTLKKNRGSVKEKILEVGTETSKFSFSEIKRSTISLSQTRNKSYKLQRKRKKN
jgi:hypothetical protein